MKLKATTIGAILCAFITVVATGWSGWLVIAKHDPQGLIGLLIAAAAAAATVLFWTSDEG